MTSQPGDNRQRGRLVSKRCPQKRSVESNWDSDGEMAVTSTSGKKVGFSASTIVKRSKLSKSLILPDSNKASKASVKPVVKVEWSSQSVKSQPASSTRIKTALPVSCDSQDMDSASNSGNQRLLMRDWLFKEVSCNRISGLKWLDKSKTLISIPWIHASKDGWSQESHCKLFEKWAIYTGKYDPNKDAPEPKRWKANFRCALNSLPDVKEVPQLGMKNGIHGYKVYRFEDAVAKKNPRKYKLPPQSLKSTKCDSPVKVVVQPVLSAPIESNSSCTERFGDLDGNSLCSPIPNSPVIAYKTEPVDDMVPSDDQQYLSISGIGESDIVTFVVGNNMEVKTTSMLCIPPGNHSLEKDIIVLRNMDHNYFRVQIPTTVENYEDDENSSLVELQLERSGKDSVR